MYEFLGYILFTICGFALGALCNEALSCRARRESIEAYKRKLSRDSWDYFNDVQ